MSAPLSAPLSGALGEIDDLLVVGAGIVGALVAVLARIRHPTWRTGLVDRTAAGHGATAYSAGLMPVLGWTAAARRRAARAGQLYDELREHGLELPISEVPACWVVPASRRGELEARCGGPLSLLPDDRCKALFAAGPTPRLASDEVTLDGGTVARLDAPAALRALLRWCRGQGIACHEGIAVRRISGGPIWTLEGSDGVARYAQRVVLATGPWMLLEDLWAPAAPIAQARTKKLVAFHVGPAPGPDARLILFPEDDVFLLPEPEQGRWLLSVPGTWDWLPEDRSLCRADVELARAVMAVRFPRWQAEVSGASVFGDAYTRDREPVVQCLAGAVVRVGCCSGSGVRLAPALAEEALAQLC